MEKFVINGGKPLRGSVHISGAKNAAVAILPAVLLADAPCVIENLPEISDVATLLRAIKQLGAEIRVINKSTVEIDPRPATSYVVDKKMAEGMRASSYFLGALLGRHNRARVAPPGGCDFGVRPIDQHVKGFEALGAKVIYENGMVNAKAIELRGCAVYLDVVSVGATINIMLAAVKARGLTVIENAAREPHIVDLANFLNSMGANIMGAGTSVIKIRGVESLHGCTYSIIPDQIEAGTFMLLAAAAGGEVLVRNIIPKHMDCLVSKLEEIGVSVTEYDDSVRICRNNKLRGTSVRTQPYPGFPTDLQPQIVALLSTVNGASTVSEDVWENRFQYIDQLRAMGAKIEINGKKAIIEGSQLEGASVVATDLRAGAAMIIAGASANGVTEIASPHYIDRGYHDIERRLRSIGVKIERIFEED